jgi:hypothetical protein
VIFKCQSQEDTLKAGEVSTRVERGKVALQRESRDAQKGAEKEPSQVRKWLP